MAMGDDVVALDALSGAAHLLARGGQGERAVELLALVIQHPAVHQGTRDGAQRLLSRLESELPPEVLAAARGRGEARDLEATAAEVLVELRAGGH